MSGRRTRDLPNFWSRSTSSKRLGTGSIFPDEQPAPRRMFVASFEKDPSKPPMTLLLGWEYGRIWLREREEFLKESRIKTKNKFIKPDFDWWISKRTMVPDRRKLFKKRLDDQQGSLPPTSPVEAALDNKKNSIKLKAKSKGKKGKKKTTATTKQKHRARSSSISNGHARKEGGGTGNASSRHIC